MQDMVVIGLGELGRLYAGAALRAGLRVTPVTRKTFGEPLPSALSTDVPVLVAVSEQSLDDVLSWLHKERRTRVILLQNELFASRFRALASEATVLVPWLLQKRTKPMIVIRPSPIYGPLTALLQSLHDAIGLPSETLCSTQARDEALRDKYTFILTINALGLAHDDTLGNIAREHRDAAEALAREADVLAAALAETKPGEAPSVQMTLDAMTALADIPARGRTAAARVERALRHADAHALSLPQLRSLYEAKRHP